MNSTSQLHIIPMQTYLGLDGSREGLDHTNQQALMERLNGQDTLPTVEGAMRDVWILLSETILVPNCDTITYLFKHTFLRFSSATNHRTNHKHCTNLTIPQHHYLLGVIVFIENNQWRATSMDLPVSRLPVVPWTLHGSIPSHGSCHSYRPFLLRPMHFTLHSSRAWHWQDKSQSHLKVRLSPGLRYSTQYLGRFILLILGRFMIYALVEGVSIAERNIQ